MILSVQTGNSLCNTKSSGTLFIFWGGMRLGTLIKTILCVRTDLPASALVLCVCSAPACALWCCPGTAEFNISFSGMRLVHVTPSSRSPGNCNSVVTEVTMRHFPKHKLCAKQPFSLEKQHSELPARELLCSCPALPQAHAQPVIWLIYAVKWPDQELFQQRRILNTRSF